MSWSTMLKALKKSTSMMAVTNCFSIPNPTSSVTVQGTYYVHGWRLYLEGSCLASMIDKAIRSLFTSALPLKWLVTWWLRYLNCSALSRGGRENLIGATFKFLLLTPNTMYWLFIVLYINPCLSVRHPQDWQGVIWGRKQTRSATPVVCTANVVYSY